MCVCVRVRVRVCRIYCLPLPTYNIFASYIAFLYHLFILGCIPLGGGAVLVGAGDAL